MIDIAQSKKRIPIRLTEERWYHIVEHHEDLAGYARETLDTVENPDFIVAGWTDEYLAVRETQKGKHLVVAYKEISKDDGFIITAYFTKRPARLQRREVLWRKHPRQST